MNERLPGQPPGVCPRCHLRAADDVACEWCGHDSNDGAAHDELIWRRRQMHALRGDREARRKWLAEGGLGPFMSCPECGQWGRTGLCEHSGFDGCDEIALAARRSWWESRSRHGATRWAEIRARLAPPRRRLPADLALDE